MQEKSIRRDGIAGHGEGPWSSGQMLAIATFTRIG